MQVNDLNFYIKFHSSVGVFQNFTGTIQLPGLSINATLATNLLKLIKLYMCNYFLCLQNNYYTYNLRCLIKRRGTSFHTLLLCSYLIQGGHNSFGKKVGGR